MKKVKLAILTSHVIQHQTPLFRELVKEGEANLTVYFCWDFGIKTEGYDHEFGRNLKWDIPLLSGYNYKILENFSLKPSSEFWGQINPGIIKELWQGGYDAVLVLGWNSFSSWLAFLTAFFLRIPIFLRGENPFGQEAFKNPVKRKIKKILLWPLFRLTSAFMYIGEENKKFYKYFGVPDKKLFFCPYSDENERYITEAEKLKSKKVELKKGLGIKPEKPVILFAGKFIDKKRPIDLLAAYKNIDDAALVMVGDGPLRRELEDYVKNKKLEDVYFVGFQNLTELPKFYALSDILVLPSGGGETWGLVVNIAMCFKMPVIVSDVVGCGPDLVRQNTNGYIFPMGDIEALSLKLKELVRDPLKRKNFGEKSFEIVQGYTYKKDVEGILEALKKTI